MARARNIKPGFFLNEELVELPFEYRLLFIGLWTIADREGRLEDRPKRIKMEIFPADNVDVDAGLDALQSYGFLQRYVVDGKRYIQVTNWKKHQQPHIKERESDIPAPDKHRAETVQAPDKHHTSPSDSLIPDSLIPDSREESSLRSDSCAEPQSSPPPETAKPTALPPDESLPGFINIPLVGKQGEFSVTENLVEEWEKAYPAVDVRQELRKIRQWNLSHERQRKTRRGILAHITGWLSREQDKGHAPPYPANRGNSSRPSRQAELEARNSAALNEWLESRFGQVIEGEVDTNARH